MKNLTFLLAAVALMSACAPYPPYGGYRSPNMIPPGQPAMTDPGQRQLYESRDEMTGRNADLNLPRVGDSSNSPVSKYPTAAAVPGKPGFVFNPYTHNIVDVKGIGSGKLVRDPEDNDTTQKFRVP
ncbi:MAG: hypothetical protein P8O22_10245 [Akkermansiaceae bacterium]|nr:hypothetical protein [Akkermansiaceae bacterium]